MTGRRARTLLAVAVVATAGAMGAVGPLAAQAAAPSLEQVDSLAAAGEADQARTVLSSWWDARADSASRSDLQRALWQRGLLTVDPRQAELDYQRLLVEYPGGPYTDGALLRLAQAERAEGRPVRALAHLRALVRDYPSSPQRLRAQALLPGVEAEAAAAAARAATDSAGAGSDTAAVAAAPGRGTGASAPAGDAQALPPATGQARTKAARPSTPAGKYAVQLGAFSTPGRARNLLDKARRAGLEPRLVRVHGSRLVRVRVGRFTGQGAADRSLTRIRAQGFDALVVSDADQEEVVP